LVSFLFSVLGAQLLLLLAVASHFSPAAAAARGIGGSREEDMGGSGKWVKSLIGLKKPDREDCKVRPLASPCS
jgi:hypothetical protein